MDNIDALGACQLRSEQGANQDANLRGAAIYFHGNPSDLFPAFIFLRLPEIISSLHCEPGLGRCTQRLLKSDGHVRADGGLSMDDPRDRGARHPELFGKRSYTDSAIFAQHRVGKNLAGVRWVKHFAHLIPSSMVVLIVNEERRIIPRSLRVTAKRTIRRARRERLQTGQY
jgi:hypothetical protein